MTQKNSSSWAERRSSCADGEVLLEFGIKEEKKLLTGPASLEIPVYRDLSNLSISFGNRSSRFGVKFDVSARTRLIIHTSIGVALFAILYRYWLLTPALKYIGIRQWLLFAVVVAAASGGLLSLVRLPLVGLAFASITGLLLGGTWTEWTIPNDVKVSVGDALMSHVRWFWWEMIMLTVASVVGEFFVARIIRRRSAG